MFILGHTLQDLIDQAMKDLLLSGSAGSVFFCLHSYESQMARRNTKRSRLMVLIKRKIKMMRLKGDISPLPNHRTIYEHNKVAENNVVLHDTKDLDF